MSFGKLYGYKENARSTSLVVLAKENNLDIEIVDTQVPVTSADYLKVNPLARIPAFVAANGWTLTETIAINIYFASQNEKTTLLGKTKQDYAQIVRWMSFFNQEVIIPVAGWFRPLIGKESYNKAAVEASKKQTEKVIAIVEGQLLINTFLTGDRITLADFFAAGIISRGFQYVFDKQWRSEHPNTTRWFETIVNQPAWQAVVPEPILIDTAVVYTPPKKEPKPAKPAAAAAPKAAAKPQEEDEDDKPIEAPKAKHPLEALGKPTLVLDDWKRKYSNEDTRQVALPWFWENYKSDEYSLWKVNYKYNDELTLTFMSANLVGGFFARLEASRKYLFGALSVYGTSNDSVIQGVFLVRGQEALPAFDVAPDYESYEFTKLDASKDKELVNDEWAWDKAIEVGGKKYEWADGKVFK